MRTSEVDIALLHCTRSTFNLISIVGPFQFNWCKCNRCSSLPTPWLLTLRYFWSRWAWATLASALMAGSRGHISFIVSCAFFLNAQTTLTTPLDDSGTWHQMKGACSESCERIHICNERTDIPGTNDKMNTLHTHTHTHSQDASSRGSCSW